MAQYYVQPIKDKDGRVNAWEVAKKHGQGTTRIADYSKGDKPKARRRALREANEGDKIGIKKRDGSYKTWLTARAGNSTNPKR